MRISDWSSDVCSSDLSAEEALRAYRNALAVDPALTGAKEGVKRVEASAKAANLRSAITQIYERLNANDAQGAEAALSRASKIDPGAPEIVDLRKRVVAAAQVAKMDSARARAEVNEKKENWRSEEHTSELQSLMRISYA